ncbi:MAG: thioredoxin domain-containing protein [Bacteroidaceae bacterium]|nr:thioredoxin domain-containing protein [Bacteroidaceae bacterium]
MKSIFLRFLDELEVQYTTQYATSTHDEHPYKNTIYGLSSMLDKYNISNVSYTLNDKEELLKLQAPFIAQVTEEIVIVKAVSNEKVKYDWRGKELDVTFEKFKDIWSGVVLLAHPSEKSIEPEYSTNKRTILFSRCKIAIIIFCAILSVVAALIGNNIYKDIYKLLFVITEIVGVFTTVLLLTKQLKVENPLADKICNLLKSGDCNDVLATKAAKFFGIANWSEIGFTFFFVNTLMAIILPETIFYISVITLLALPYTLWSVWYQKFKAHRWCVLCLIVQGLLWITTLVSLLGGVYNSPSCNIPNLISLLSLYGVTLFSLNMLLPKFIKADELSFWKNNFNSLKARDNVFKLLLEEQKKFIIDDSASTLIFGNPDAPMQVTIFGNPYCNPCAELHKKLHMFEGYEIGIRYIFTSFRPEYNNINKYLIAVYQQLGEEKATDIYNKWYDGGKAEKEKFFENYNLDIENENVLVEFKNHQQWIKNSRLSSTPTIIVNGHLLPSEYKIEDLIYFIDKTTNM